MKERYVMLRSERQQKNLHYQKAKMTFQEATSTVCGFLYEVNQSQEVAILVCEVKAFPTHKLVHKIAFRQRQVAIRLGNRPLVFSQGDCFNVKVNFNIYHLGSNLAHYAHIFKMSCLLYSFCLLRLSHRGHFCLLVCF